MDVFDHRPTWTHREGDSYTPVFGPIVGNIDYWERDWRAIGEPSPNLDAAIKAGLKAMDSDDFNIAVRQNGRVVALLWMHEDMGEEPGVLSEVGRALEMGA